MAKKKELQECTVALLKPDAIKKNNVGEIITRLERLGLKIIAGKMVWVKKTHVGKHYTNDRKYTLSVGNKALDLYSKYGYDIEENFNTKDALSIGKKVRKWNMEFLSSGPVFALLLEGPNAVAVVRKVAGSTFSADASPGTIRGDFGTDSIFSSNKENRAAENVIHVSATQAEAKFERQLWFKEDEIYSY